MTRLFPKTRPAWVKPVATAFLAGAILGGAGYGVGYLLATQFLPDGDLALALRWSDVLAVLVAASLIIGAGVVMVTSLSPAHLGRMYHLEGLASASEASQARLQALVMGFSGVILLLPLGFDMIGVAPAIGVAVIVLLFALHTAMNLRVYRQADELLRRTMLESATATFFIGQAVLFLWAAAERMGAAPTLTAWDIYAVLMAGYLTASGVVSARRGLAY